MSTDGHTDTFGQPATYCSNCYTEFNTTSSGAYEIYLDANSFVASPSHNASPNQPLAEILGATATRDQHIPIWSPDLSPVNHAYDGYNNGWNPNVSIPPAWGPASQGFAQSLSPVTPGFGQPFYPAGSSVNYSPVHSNAITNGQPDPTLQLPDFGVHNDFGAHNDFGVHNDFGGTPNDFANPTPFTHWGGDLTTIDPQETMASFNQLPLSTTSGMPAAPVSPAHATSMFNAPAGPRPIARRVTSQRSNVNTNPHICNYTGCGKIFGRLGDLVRHRQKHGVPQHPCLVHGCNRRGPEAFYRADKLRDHQRKKHRMAV